MSEALGGECIQLWSDSILEWKLRAVVLLFPKSGGDIVCKNQLNCSGQSSSDVAFWGLNDASKHILMHGGVLQIGAETQPGLMAGDYIRCIHW